MRIILDIATEQDKKEVLNRLIDHYSGEIATAVCIDETNTAQFHNDTSKNKLTDEQIQAFSDFCDATD